jgi:hypothetical protein
MKIDRSRIKVYTITVLTWILACVGVNAWLISSYLANPRDGDLYAHTWGYQFVVFSIFRLPIWFLGLLVVLAAEFAFFARHSKIAATRGDVRQP